MAQDQIPSAPNGKANFGNGDEGSSLPLRRSGRTRKRPSNHSENADNEAGPPTTPPVSTDVRRNAKRKAAPEVFDVPEDLLEASLGPWKENEQSDWASWIELESDPVGTLSSITLSWQVLTPNRHSSQPFWAYSASREQG
jgi:ubiquitin carboxyl-terminal hydrolase L5